MANSSWERDRGVWEGDGVMQLVRMSCLASADRITLLGRTPFFSYKHFGSPTRDEVSQLVTSYNAP